MRWTARRAFLALVFLIAASCRIDDARPLASGNGGSPETAPGAGGSSGPGVSGSGATGIAARSGAGGNAGPTGGAAGTLSPGACADLFSDDQLTTYEIQIAPAEWSALVSDFHNMQQNRNAGRDIHPYHPLAEFRYGAEVVPSAMIRLKGYSSWYQAIGDPAPKMQFVISFNEIDSNARFHGLRKLELDMPRIDVSYLRHRISLSFLRALGLPAQCANSGRLFINGAFYGLFTNLERPDKEFVRRLFPEADRGDLWDGGWALQTNEDTMALPHPRLDAFWAAVDVTSLAAIADMDEALLEWAGEAMLADADGYWIGHWNFFLYDHPTRGWLWLPHDLDTAINWTDPRIDPLYYWRGSPIWEPTQPHYAAVLRDYTWRERYIGALRRAHEVYAAAGLPEQLDRAAAQIRDAAAADPTRPFSFDDHLLAVANLRAALVTRGESVAAWLACRAAPDGDIDADGDLRPVCMDCQDDDSQTYPGAVEICGDRRDQDCDGRDQACP